MTASPLLRLDGIAAPLSRVIAGTAREEFFTATGADRILDDVTSVGITTLDTARAYLRSEEAIGRWMQRRRNREAVTIITKGCHPTATDWRRVHASALRSDVDESRRQLRTEYLDVYLLHRDDPDVPVSEIVDTLNELQQVGAIRAFGASNWTHRRLEEANAYARVNGLSPFVVSSPNFGLAEQVADPWGHGSVTISGPENADARRWYREHAMPIIAWAPLARGFFSGLVKADDTASTDVLDEHALRGYVHPRNLERLRRVEETASRHGATVPQVALAWLFAHPFDVLAVVSASSASRMQQNLEALDLQLDAAEIAYVDLTNDAAPE